MVILMVKLKVIPMLMVINWVTGLVILKVIY